MRPLTLGVLVSAASERSFAPETRESSSPTPQERQSPEGSPPCEAEIAPNAALPVSVEHATDLQSGADLCTALRELGHWAHPITVNRDLDLALRHFEIDACLLALHGHRGGRGEVQSLLTMRGMPFAGADATAVSVAFDKVRARQILAFHNLPVPPSIVLGGARKTHDRDLELLGWPCYVKPRRGALGQGVTLLDHVDHVQEALDTALQYDREVILERALPGREVQVVLLGDRVVGSLEVLARNISGVSESVCPPQLSRPRLQGVYGLARRAVAALGLQDGLTRVDVLVDERLNEFILEVEPVPPLHRDGIVAQVATAHGMDYLALVGQLLERIVLRAASHPTAPSIPLTLLQ